MRYIIEETREREGNRQTDSTQWMFFLFSYTKWTNKKFNKSGFVLEFGTNIAHFLYAIYAVTRYKKPYRMLGRTEFLKQTQKASVECKLEWLARLA